MPVAPVQGPEGLLAGLVTGYTGELQRQAEEQVKSRGQSRQLMLEYLGHLASNPNVPAEHQQWALGKISELAQADPTKKLPKIDLGELPPVMRQPPSQQAVPPALPQMTLQPPVAAGQPGGPVTGQQPPSAPSGDVGRQSNGQVNALGDLQPPVRLPGESVTIPAQQQAPVQHPVAPEQIAPGGQLHITTNDERLQQQMDAQAEAVNRLQAQYPSRSREDLAYFMQHGEFPKPQEFTLGPGQKRFTAEGKVLAANEEAKPGAKSGFEPVMGPGGPIGVKDVATGGMLTPEQVKQNPQAKAVLDQATEMHSKQLKEQEDKEARAQERANAMESRREQAAINKQVTAAAVDASKKAKPMVDVLDASERYMKGGQFTPRQDLALVVRAVRAMNPGSVRLPQKELDLELRAGSYGDRFKRWYTTATQGLLPADQRQDLMRVIKEETTQTATSAAQNWQQAFGGTQKIPPYLKRFTLQPPQSPPSSGFDWGAHPVVEQPK